MRYAKMGLLACMLFAVLLIVHPVVAQENVIGYPEPFIPQFAIKFVDHSYDVPTITTSTINQYTGEITNTTQQGYHVENKTVDIIIENQPLPVSNKTYTLFYNVREKGHFGSDWHEIYRYVSFTFQTMEQGTPAIPEPQEGTCPVLNNKYTIVSLKYNVGDKIDFQVQAVYGYSTPSAIQHMLMASLDYGYIYGNWSQTQTITIPEIAQTPIPNPTNAPTPQPIVPATINPAITAPEATKTPIEAQTGVQTVGMLFFENKNVIVFGVSCILLGALLVVLAFSRGRGNGNVKCLEG